MVRYVGVSVVKGCSRCTHAHPFVYLNTVQRMSYIKMKSEITFFCEICIRLNEDLLWRRTVACHNAISGADYRITRVRTQSATTINSCVFLFARMKAYTTMKMNLGTCISVKI